MFYWATRSLVIWIYIVRSVSTSRYSAPTPKLPNYNRWWAQVRKSTYTIQNLFGQHFLGFTKGGARPGGMKSGHGPRRGRLPPLSVKVWVWSGSITGYNKDYRPLEPLVAPTVQLCFPSSGADSSIKTPDFHFSTMTTQHFKLSSTKIPTHS